jgi:hypothetical protein
MRPHNTPPLWGCDGPPPPPHRLSRYLEYLNFDKTTESLHSKVSPQISTFQYFSQDREAFHLSTLIHEGFISSEGSDEIEISIFTLNHSFDLG